MILGVKNSIAAEDVKAIEKSKIYPKNDIPKPSKYCIAIVVNTNVQILAIIKLLLFMFFYLHFN